jgi:hypothetical protein
MGFIKYLDIFGKEFSFKIFGYSSYKTTSGGILTIIMFFITSVLTFMFGVDLIKKSNPRVMMERVIPINYSYINCTIQNFPLYWRISDDNSANVDFTNILYPKLSFYVYKLNKSDNSYIKLDEKELPIQSCTRKLVNNDAQYDKYGLNNFYCIDWSLSGYPLGGFWDGSELIYYFEQVFYTCPNDNKTSPDCANQNKIKEFLGSSNKIYYEIYYPQVALSTSNSTNPIHHTAVNYFQMLSPYLYKKNRYFFSEIELKSDKGIIFTDTDYIKLISFDDLTYDIGYLSDSDFFDPNISSGIFATTIYLSKNYNRYNLSYLKIQDVAAQVGGIIKILLILCFCINHYINIFRRDLDVINKMFDFKKFIPYESKILNTDKNTIDKYIKKKTLTCNCYI